MSDPVAGLEKQNIISQTETNQVSRIAQTPFKRFTDFLQNSWFLMTSWGEHDI